MNEYEARCCPLSDLFKQKHMSGNRPYLVGDKLTTCFDTYRTVSILNVKHYEEHQWITQLS